MLRRARHCARFQACCIAGTALGKIHAFRPVSGAEDMGTLQKVANEMERLGYGRSAEEFAKTGLSDGRSAGPPWKSCDSTAPSC